MAALNSFKITLVKYNIHEVRFNDSLKKIKKYLKAQRKGGKGEGGSEREREKERD